MLCIFKSEKMFCKGRIVSKKENRKPEYFPAPTAGGIWRECWEGGRVNMWTDVTLWLARADLEHVCSDMTGPLDRKICFDIYVEKLNASFINQKC